MGDGVTRTQAFPLKIRFSILHMNSFENGS